MSNNIFGIKDAANFTVRKKSDGKVFLFSDYATVATNEWKADTIYALSKSTKAIRWDYNKESTLKATLEIFDMKWISMMAGSEFVTGATNVLQRKVLTVSATNTITLTDTPITGSLLVYKLEADGLSNGEEQTVGTPTSSPNTYSIADKIITLNTTSCPQNTSMVVYYLKTSETTAKTLTIAASQFPFSVDIFADTMIRDTDGNDKYVQIHYLNAKAQANFTITMSASEITKLEVTFDLFKDSASDAMATYTIL
jgi:hypothetical protein